MNELHIDKTLPPGRTDLSSEKKFLKNGGGLSREKIAYPICHNSLDKKTGGDAVCWHRVCYRSGIAPYVKSKKFSTPIFIFRVDKACFSVLARSVPQMAEKRSILP